MAMFLFARCDQMSLRWPSWLNSRLWKCLFAPKKSAKCSTRFSRSRTSWFWFRMEPVQTTSKIELSRAVKATGFVYRCSQKRKSKFSPKTLRTHSSSRSSSVSPDWPVAGRRILPKKPINTAVSSLKEATWPSQLRCEALGMLNSFLEMLLRL